MHDEPLLSVTTVSEIQSAVGIPVTVVAVAGEIDVSSAPLLREAVAQRIGDGPPRLVLDLAGVGFCDSSGLSALIALRTVATEQEGWLRLACVPVRVRKLLRLTGLDRLFPSYDTVEHAAALG